MKRDDPGRARRIALLALVALTLVWSFNWVVMKWAMRYAGPFDFSALRYVAGTLVLFVALLVRGRSLRPPPLGPVILIGLAQTMAFQALVQWALVGGGAGKTALLAYTMPFWVVLLGWLVLAERLRLRQGLGVVAAFVGLLLVIAPWRGLAGLAPVALALGGGFFWAVGTVASKRVFNRGGVSLLALTAWQMLVGTLGLVALALAVPERAIDWSPAFIGVLAYNGVLSSGLAWALWALIVRNLPAQVAGLATLAIPVLGIGFAWALLGERPSAVEAAGIVLIVAALFAVLRAPRGR